TDTFSFSLSTFGSSISAMFSSFNVEEKVPMSVREQKLVLEGEDHQRPKCGSEMRDGKRQKTLKDGTVSTYEIMRCTNKQCANQLSKRKNTFFAFTDSLGRANSKLSDASILEIIWLWCFNITLKTISWTIGCSEATTVDWCNFLRDICTEKMNVGEQMGGIGEVVQIDESLFRGKRKYNRGKLLLGNVNK
ncbi:unnamed protein product, partial [Didymodactylos carnosus]